MDHTAQLSTDGGIGSASFEDKVLAVAATVATGVMICPVAKAAAYM